MIPRNAITGLVLAGGRGTRMGGIDKGLQPFRGRSLVANAMQRLAPQVGPLMMNANRHLDAYAALGAPVWPDEGLDHPGPLAGFLAGLTHCTTEWLVTVPCDAPMFPLDLVERLAAVLASGQSEIASAATREGDARRPQPVFCLMRATLAPSLRQHLESGGERQVGAWVRRHGGIEVPFDDAAAFANANTPLELHELQRDD